jgi:hypothetical protein
MIVWGGGGISGLWNLPIQFFSEIDRGEKNVFLWRQSLWMYMALVNFGKKLNGQRALRSSHPVVDWGDGWTQEASSLWCRPRRLSTEHCWNHWESAIRADFGEA